MTVSAFDGVFASHRLTREFKGGHVDPVTDLWIEDGTITESFRVWYDATSNPAIVAQVGADSLSAAVEGGMLSPLQPPKTAQSGAVYVVDGGEQRLTVIWLPSVIAELDEAIGREFVGKLVS